MVQIGNIQVLLESREIRADGHPVHIGSRAFGVLQMLVLARGTLVSKDEIMRCVWPDTIVEENNLQVHIATLRKVLGKDRDFIRTVPGRGYVLLHSPAGNSAQALSPLAAALDICTLIGRGQVVTEISDLIRTTRTLTLVGAGGIGKTRLAAAVALDVAPHFSDGACFVPLATVSEHRFVVDALATALGIKESVGKVSLKQIAAETAGRRMLIVLDNCEHVVDAAAELTEVLTSTSGEMHVLATSREALRIRGETLYSVPPLGTADDGRPSHEVLESGAVQLFLARARAIDHGFASSERALGFVNLVCRRLDGIPLAIELAAARAVTLGIEPLAEHLDDRLSILAGGPRTALPRHQTLKATFDWSYMLLDDLEQVLFRRLGLFVHSFTFDGALHVMEGRAAHAEILQALSGLVSKSLIIRESSDAPRYRLLESTRAYALQKLHDNGEWKSASRAHAMYLQEFFRRARKDWSARATDCSLNMFRKEVVDLRAALDWAFASAGSEEVGINLSVVAVPFLFELSLLDECTECAKAALSTIERLEKSDAMGNAKLRLLATYAAALAYSTGPTDFVRHSWHEVLAMATARGEIAFEAQALWGLWNAQQLGGDVREALAYAHRLGPLAERAGNPALSTLARCVEGIAMHYVGDQRTARERLERMLLTCSPDTHQWQTTGFQIDHGIAARAMLARVLWTQGQVAEALLQSKAAIDAATACGHDMTTCYVLGETTVPLALLTEDIERAGQAIRTLRAESRRAGFSIWAACSDAYEEYMWSMTNEGAARLSTFRTAIERLKTLRFLAPLTFLLGRLSWTLLASGRVGEAINTVNEALRVSEETGNAWYYPELCRVRAQIAIKLRCFHEAETWFSAALEHSTRQGAGGLAFLALESLRDAALPPADSTSVFPSVVRRSTDGDAMQYEPLSGRKSYPLAPQ